MKLLQLDDGSVLSAMLRARWASEGYDVADHTKDTTVQDLARTADVVVHMSTGWDAAAAERDLDTVTQALAGLGGSGKRFLYLSDASVLGDTADSFGNEDNPTSAATPHPWQVRIEEMVLGAVAEGIRSVVVRPALVHGPAGGSLIDRLTVKAHDHGRSVYVDDGHWRTSTVNATDLIDLIVHMARHAPEGMRYLAASTEVLTWRQIAEIISSRTNAEKGAVSISTTEASELGLDAPRMTINSVVRDDAAHRRFGWTPHAEPFASSR